MQTSTFLAIVGNDIVEANKKLKTLVTASGELYNFNGHKYNNKASYRITDLKSDYLEVRINSDVISIKDNFTYYIEYAFIESVSLFDVV